MRNWAIARDEPTDGVTGGSLRSPIPPAERRLSIGQLGFLAAVLRDGAFEILQLLARQQADLFERSKVLPRARQVGGRQVGPADVLVRAAMAGIDLDRALVVFEREVVLLQVAI